ncbi:MAG: hypothetical protein IPP71_01835 [Bacteroidetes bacterium]|nr:hypothetical protein [Bacteroidota bacterium]
MIADASGIIPVTTENSVNDLAIQNIVIPKNGYIYIYVANESPTPVYFDNLTILHKKSNVSELNDYYPFGLLNQFQSQTSLSFDPINKLQYQGKELQSQLNLSRLDFGLRHYDATLGRWGVQDPKMQYFNPYVAMGNNPVSHIDPDGGLAFAPTMSGDGLNDAETHGGGGEGSVTYAKFMNAARFSDSYIGISGSSWTTNSKGKRVNNEAYFDQLMKPAGGVSFSFYKASFNGATTGTFSSLSGATNSLNDAMDKYIAETHGEMLNSFSNSGGGEKYFDSEFTYTSSDGTESKGYFHKGYTVKDNSPINLMAGGGVNGSTDNKNTSVTRFLNYFEEGSADGVNANSNMLSKKAVNNALNIFGIMAGGSSILAAKGAFASVTYVVSGLSIINNLDGLSGASSNISNPETLKNIGYIKNSVDAVGVASGVYGVLINRNIGSLPGLMIDASSIYNNTRK